MRSPPLAVAAFALLAAACTDVQLRVVDPSRPARPEGCAVDLRPAERTLPQDDFTEVAAGTISCFGGRARCLDEIRKRACAVGADTVYAFSESEGGGFTNIEAHYAARLRPPSSATGPGAR